MADEGSDWLFGFFTFLYDAVPLPPLEREEEGEEKEANEEEEKEEEEKGGRK